MLPSSIIVGLLVTAAILALLYVGTRSLLPHGWGKVVLLVGVVALPTLLSIGNFSYGVHESSRTEFCLSCHEMKRYGMSLFADDRQALPAVHYQNRLIDRDTTCYSCHKDYALFGDLKAKLNGLRHVWVHYTQPIPEKIALYQPFPNSNCLHCHDDSRRFVEAPVHVPIASALASGRTSCLSCHRSTHDLAAVDAHKFLGSKVTPVDVSRQIRRAIVFVGLGLLVQLATAFRWTPGTFVLSALVGAPLVLVGTVLFLRAVVRSMREKGAL